MKVMTVVGTRPELIKLSRVIARLDTTVDHVLVHTGQNHHPGLRDVFYEDLGIRRPDHALDLAGATAAATIAAVIERVDELLAAERPDALVIYGDTNSCLAVIPACRRRVPVFHLEAGNRCYDDRVPEEVNRRLVDHLSHVNLALTEHGRRALLAEGRPASSTYVVGSPMREVLDHAAPAIEASTIVASLGVEPDGYLVVSAHREEHVDDPAALAVLAETLAGLADEWERPVLVTTHPRTRARLGAAGLRVHPAVQLLDPLRFTDYVRLQRDATCVVSDSGTVGEEASLVGFAAVTPRLAHERPESVDRGAVIVTGLASAEVLRSVRLAVDLQRADPSPRRVEAYDTPDFAERVVRIVVGQADVVRRRIWPAP